MEGVGVCVSLADGVVVCVSLVEGVEVRVSLVECVVVRVSLVVEEGVADAVGLALGEPEAETVGDGVLLWLPPRERLAVGVEGGVPEREMEGVVVSVPLVVGEGVAEEVGLALEESEGETVGEGVQLWLPPRERLAVGVEGGVPEREVEGDAVSLAAGAGVSLPEMGVAEAVVVGEGLSLGEPDGETVGEGVSLWLPPRVGLAVGVEGGVPEREEDDDVVCVWLPVGEEVAAGVGLPLGVPEGETVGVEPEPTLVV